MIKQSITLESNTLLSLSQSMPLQTNLLKENVTKKLIGNFHQKKSRKDFQFLNRVQIRLKNYRLNRFGKRQIYKQRQVLKEL